MSPVVIENKVRIPEWVADHASFRRWVRSAELPEHGRFSYLQSELWVDLSIERLIHNLLKGEFQRVLSTLTKSTGAGRYFSDGMLLTDESIELSTQPDGMFVSAKSLEKKAVMLTEGDQALEIQGTPDMVLEVVSETSVRKDTVVLRDLYRQASIAEYWLVDSRLPRPTFEILRHADEKYLAVRKSAGWLKSAVFGKSFRLVQQKGPDGVSEFTLESK